MNTSLGSIQIAGYTFVMYELVPIMTLNRGVNLHSGACPSITKINKYGDTLFCEFHLPSAHPYFKQKGLYCFMIGNCVKYIGKTTMGFGPRLNAYGHISAGVCSHKGQSTNCRINSLINKAFCAGLSVRVGFCMLSNNETNSAEKSLLDLRFDWNIQLY